MATEVLTHTKRRDFANCRRYYFHRHVQHLSPRWQKGGRRRGSAFGSTIFALEQLTRSGFDGDMVPAARDVLAAEYDDALDACRSSEDREELEIEISKLTYLAPAYVQRYGLHSRRELEFDKPLLNPRTGYTSRAFRLGGKIDGLVAYEGKHAVVIEDKLVGQIQQAMIQRLPLDHQATEYVDTILRFGWTAEVWYRHTLVPQINPRLVGTKKTGGRRRETLDEFEARLAEDIADRPDHYFDEQRLVFPQQHLDDYRKGRWGQAQQILEARRVAKRTSFEEAYPMNPSRCWEFGGCEFIPLCTKREGAEDLYVTVPDNPELSQEDDSGTTSEYPAAAG